MQCICEPTASGTKPIYFINAAFNTCTYTSLDIGSFIFGWISLFLWIVAMYPQARDQYITKEVGALSAWLIFQWLFADFLNLVSVFVLDLLFTQKILGAVWEFMDVVLVFQQIYYKKSKNTGASTKMRMPEIIIYCLICSIVIISIVIFGILQGQLYELQPDKYLKCGDADISQARRIAGNVMSYAAIPLYIMTRPFQIYKNHKRQSVEGLSLIMFIITLLANFTQFLTLLIDSINTAINDPDNVNYDQIAFYIAAIVPCILDCVILYQFFRFNKKNKKQNDNEDGALRKNGGSDVIEAEAQEEPEEVPAVM